jgi:hypothetical protein
MTEQRVIDPSDEPPDGPERDHPPFRLREKRLVLLPDLRPPSLEELRWSVRERRRRRDQPIPAPRHARPEDREPTDVVTSIDAPVVEETGTSEPPLEIVLPEAGEPAVAEPDRWRDDLAPEPDDWAPEDWAPERIEAVAEPADSAPEEHRSPEPQRVSGSVVEAVEAADADLAADLFDLAEPEFPDLRAWHPAVLPDPEPDEIAPPSWASTLVDEPSLVEPEVLPEEPEPEPAPPVDLAPEPLVEPDRSQPEPDEELPPLVSQILVVREPTGDPGRIAVLDDVEVSTVTRLVPLPVPEPVVEAPAYDAIYPDDLVPVEDIEADLEVADDEVADDTELRAAPLYWRLLRLRYTRPNGWLRALYFEGAVALGVVLVLAELASVWTIVVLPLVVAVVVKANDVLAGNLRRAYRQPKRPDR